MDKSLPSYFGRVGSKSRLKDKIYRMMPNDFKTFVEPYVGGGAVMLGYKFKPGQKIVINDLDSELMKNYKIMKKGVRITPAILARYNNQSAAFQQKILDSPS